ncbi:MAG TPA: YeeE/YedE family protein [Polyangiaceae bacterium]
MTTYTPMAAFVGGAFIGLAAAVLFGTAGKIAGISGIFGGALVPKEGDTAWRWAFLAGLVLTGVLLQVGHPPAFADPIAQPTWITIVAGALVGAGTQIGNGCTSGHGVCGISRFSKRSIVAVLVFMTSAVVTVFVMRQLGAVT